MCPYLRLTDIYYFLKNICSSLFSGVANKNTIFRKTLEKNGDNKSDNMSDKNIKDTVMQAAKRIINKHND